MELLSPAGTMEKLKTALYFGADAVYLAGKTHGLRAFAGNFTNDELKEASKLVHSLGKKMYVTVNIVAHNADFEGLEDYLKFLYEIKVDAIIVSDIGIITLARKVVPNLDVHVSTQANVTNLYAAKFFASLGVKRIVLARELSLKEIKEIKNALPEDVELESFVHGAMCISYSGRCLLSNYFRGRESNKGACVQACRWAYHLKEVNSKEEYPIAEDERGTYILNSKDLCLIKHLKELEQAGICSLKIEGRMKSVYYVANVTNAYRMALDNIKNKKLIDKLYLETEKSSHRQYTSGFYFKEDKDEEREYLEDSMPVQSYDMVAVVTGKIDKKHFEIEQRNMFKVGDELEILSPNLKTFNKTFIVKEMKDLDGNIVEDARKVQQKLILQCNINLNAGDILRKKTLKV